VGITPTVSIGSTDLHSVGQLYLDGPADKCTTFVSIERAQHKYIIPKFPALDALVPHIQEKTFSQIMDAMVSGTKAAYRKKERPYISVIMPEKNSLFLGQFLQLSLYEMVYLAYLLDVNPFDQPGVERYKTETREILSYD
jgi:glucose-6-phosphate isomerase